MKRGRSRVIAGVLAASLAGAIPARAEFPFIVQAAGAAGAAYAGHAGREDAGFGGIANAGIAYRHRPGRALTLTAEWTGYDCMCSKRALAYGRQLYLDGIEAGSLLMGMELSRPGKNVTRYAEWAVGPSRAQVDESSGWASRRAIEWGVGVGAGIGFIVNPPPHSVGLNVGLRTSSLIVRGSAMSVVGFLLGLTIRG